MILIRNRFRYEKVFHKLEADYEEVVRQNMIALLPTFYVLKFNALILGEEGSRRKPDLALIHKEYRIWVIVEVELEHHSLEQHVRPQVHAFSTAIYDHRHANALLKHDETLDRDRLRDLVLHSPPEVALVVNSRSVLERGWQALEADYSCRLIFLEIFRSDHDDTLVSVTGWLPEAKPRVLSTARKIPMMNALKCRRRSQLPIHDGKVEMYCEDRSITWKAFDTADGAILLPSAGNFTIKPERNYEIVVTDEGRVRLQLA